jgi:hypothetical protein
MALALVIFGLVGIVVAIRGTYGDLGKLLTADFTGSGSFLYWVAAVAILGAIGYVPYLQRPMRALLALVVLSFMLANGSGFISKLQSALSSPTPTAAPKQDTIASEAPTTAIPVSLNVSGGSSGGSGSSGASTASSALGMAGMVASLIAL